MRRFFLALLVLLITENAYSCRGNQPIEDLLVDLSAFPDGWTYDLNGPSPISDAPLGGTSSVESIEVFFYVEGGGANEWIRRFDNPGDAFSEYNRQLAIVFAETVFTSAWTVPDDISSLVVSADYYHYACSEDEGVPWPSCAYIAQYGVYFVGFSTGMVPGYMSDSTFKEVIQAIDRKLVGYSSK